MIEDTSGEPKPCIFPFKYSGQTLTECTKLRDPENSPWCSTKVDNEGKHVKSGGFWGHCGQECDQNHLETVKAELSLKPGKCLNEGGINTLEPNFKIKCKRQITYAEKK